MSARTAILPVLFLSFGMIFAACGGDDGETEDEGLPACPTAGTDLTYANFGEAFFTSYCTSCHAEGTAVAGAETRPFTDQASIQKDAELIYKEAGGTNDDMPQAGSPQPTADERVKLAEWLSCGAK